MSCNFPSLYFLGFGINVQLDSCSLEVYERLNSSHFHLPGLPSLSLQFWTTAVLCLGLPSPSLWPGNFLQAVSQSSGRAHLFLFLVLSRITDCQCWMSSVLSDIVLHILSNFLVSSGRRFGLTMGKCQPGLPLCVVWWLTIMGRRLSLLEETIRAEQELW